MLFVTPEYNRSVPGVLKNAIDVGSRPYGKSAWSAKPCAVVSNSPGNLSALRRQPSPAAVAGVPQHAHDAAARGLHRRRRRVVRSRRGTLTNDSTRDFLKKFLDAFAAWIEKILAK